MRKCVIYLLLDGLEFISGLDYKVEFNPVCNRMVIYNIWGYTFISPLLLNTHFVQL